MSKFKLARTILLVNLLTSWLFDQQTNVNCQHAPVDENEFELDDVIPEKYNSDGMLTSDTGVSAPSTGNFFYVEFNAGGVEGEYFLEFTIGSTH